MVFRPMPWHAPTDKHIESGWCDRNGLCQHFLCFLYATGLAERRGEPAILVRVIGVRANATLSRLNRSIIFAGILESDGNDQQVVRQIRIARVEPNTFLHSDAAFPRVTRPRQH